MLFFRPLGRTVEERRATSHQSLRRQAGSVARLNGWKTDLKAQLKEAARKSQSVGSFDAEQEMDEA